MALHSLLILVATLPAIARGDLCNGTLSSTTTSIGDEESEHCLLGVLNAKVVAPRQFHFPRIGVVVGYEFLQDLGEVEFTLVAPTGGWLGFGISETGSMIGADMVVVERREDGSPEVTDRYSRAFAEPELDKVHNWQLVSFADEPAPPADSTSPSCAVGRMRSSGRVTTVRLRRLAKTCDAEDEELSPKWLRNYFIAAYGESPRIQYHGSSREVASHYFFVPKPVMQADVLGTDTVDLPTVRMLVPAGQTQYCFSRVEIPCGMRVRAWQVFGTTNLHHLHLMKLDSDTELGWSGPYQCSNYPLATPVLSWGVGDTKTIMPNDLFIDLPAGVYLYEVHTENPSGQPFHSEPGFRVWVDDSSVDPNKELKITPFFALWPDLLPAGQVTRKSFVVPDECMNLLPASGTTVVVALAHMHTSGSSLRGYRTRRGRTDMVFELRHYDFNRQAVIYKPFELLPGDTFSWECTFDLRGFQEPRAWGLAVTDEMCGIHLGVNPPMPFIHAMVGPVPYGRCSGALCRSLEECQDPTRLPNGTELYEVPWNPVLEETGHRREACQLLAMAEAAPPFNNWVLPHGLVLQMCGLAVLHISLVYVYAHTQKAPWTTAVKRSLNLIDALLGLVVGGIIAGHLEWFEGEEGKVYDVAQEPVSAFLRPLSLCGDFVGVVYLHELIVRAVSRVLRWDLLLHHAATLALIAILRNGMEYELAPQTYAGTSAALLLHVVVDVPVLLLMVVRDASTAETKEHGHSQNKRSRWIAGTLLVLGLLKLLMHLAADCLSLVCYTALNGQEAHHLAQVSFQEWFKRGYNTQRPLPTDWSSQQDWTAVVKPALPVILVLLLVSQTFTSIVLVRVARKDLRRQGRGKGELQEKVDEGAKGEQRLAEEAPFSKDARAEARPVAETFHKEVAVDI